MDASLKKTVLRMIPYGLYVLTAKGKDDTMAAATVNWRRSSRGMSAEVSSARRRARFRAAFSVHPAADRSVGRWLGLAALESVTSSLA